MPTVETTTVIDGRLDKQTIQIEDNDSGFMVIIHQQNIKVDVPEFVEVNPQDTIRVMEEMSQPAWEWISRGALFKHLWNEAFDPSDRYPPPERIELLNLGDYGVRHIAGMIVLGCEACMAGKNVFYRNPETYLHPKTERYIGGMLHKMLDLFNRSGEVKVKVKGYTRKDGREVEGYERTKPTPRPKPEDDKAQTVEWLQKLIDHYGDKKEIVEVSGEGRLTCGEMMEHVVAETPRGLWFVKEFVRLRDGG